MKTFNRNLYTAFALGTIGWTSAFGAEVKSSNDSKFNTSAISAIDIAIAAAPNHQNYTTLYNTLEAYLKNNGNPDACTKSDHTILWHACQCPCTHEKKHDEAKCCAEDRLAIVKLLLEHRVSQDDALHMAVEFECNFKIVKTLLAQPGAKEAIGKKDREGHTALFWAALWECPTISCLLMENGGVDNEVTRACSSSAKNTYILPTSATDKAEETEEKIIDTTAMQSNQLAYEDLANALSKGSEIDTIDKILKISRLDLSKYPNCWSLIKLIIEPTTYTGSEKCKLIARLCQAGMDIFSKDNAGNTALDYASTTEQQELYYVIKDLENRAPRLNKKQPEAGKMADETIKDRDNKSPTAAAKNDTPKIIIPQPALQQKHPSQLDAINEVVEEEKQPDTPARAPVIGGGAMGMVPVGQEQKSTKQALIDKLREGKDSNELMQSLYQYIIEDGNMDAVWDKKETLIYLAASNGLEMATELLLLAGANKQITDSDAQLPIDRARALGYKKIVDKLKEAEEPVSVNAVEICRTMRKLPFAEDETTFKKIDSMLDPKWECFKNYKFRSFFIIQAILLKSEDIALEIIKKLVFKAGININSEDTISKAFGKESIGAMPLDLAIDTGQYKIADFIISQISPQ
ncbi:MAG: ankyrin repeat domain-containing protein [Candidatus Babeliales bacterium]